MSELRSAIRGFRSVSEGPDRVHNNMLRHLPEVALKVFLTVFNDIWRKGEFPVSWREATVIPLLMPGKTGMDPLHYRPISLTPYNRVVAGALKPKSSSSLHPFVLNLCTIDYIDYIDRYR